MSVSWRWSKVQKANGDLLYVGDLAIDQGRGQVRRGSAIVTTQPLGLDCQTATARPAECSWPEVAEPFDPGQFLLHSVVEPPVGGPELAAEHFGQSQVVGIIGCGTVEVGGQLFVH